jgi:hypothetical protein
MLQQKSLPKQHAALQLDNQCIPSAEILGVQWETSPGCIKIPLDPKAPDDLQMGHIC